MKKNKPICIELFHCTSLIDAAHTLKARDFKDPLCVVFEVEETEDGTEDRSLHDD